MKYLESTYDEYLNSVNNFNVHKTYESLYNKLSEDTSEINHMIFYGPSGIGKYSQMLHCIKKYSKTNLKYDKKFNVDYNKKKEYLFRMSDIHYEIDMELLGCNARLLWIAVFNQIIDIIQAKKDNKIGFIVCKNFHTIHSELLELFYSYMQHDKKRIKFILLTEQISFIPSKIIDTCDIFSFSRPLKRDYKKLANNETYNSKPSSIINIKNTKLNVTQLQKSHTVVCDSILEILYQFDQQYSELRENLYNILIYKLDVYQCICYIYSKLIDHFNCSEEIIQDINIELYKCIKYYNNNYRPIYHLERMVLYIINKAYGN